jgi:hypothetical protein
MSRRRGGNPTPSLGSRPFVPFLGGSLDDTGSSDLSRATRDNPSGSVAAVSFLDIQADRRRRQTTNPAIPAACAAMIIAAGSGTPPTILIPEPPL